MAKTQRVTFEGEGVDLVMRLAFPAIGRACSVPIGQLFEQYGWTGFRHGMKQRFGDFLAQDKELTARQKEQIAYDKSEAYKAHLLAGGDWKMTGERDTVTEVIEAILRLYPKKYTKQDLLDAIEYDEEQVAAWRQDAEVRLEMAKERTRKLEAAAKENKGGLVINLKQ